VDTPIDIWNAALREIDADAMCGRLAGQMRSRRLRFGDRILCPFLRPFFLDAADEGRVTRAAELLWTLGERVARAAIADRALLHYLGLTEAEIRLAHIDPGYETTSTAGRADAFLLPDSLQFAEYNGESPAGAGYSQLLAELFDEEPLMARFRDRFSARMYRPIERLFEALMASYGEWGGRASPPLIAIVDWREVPTFSEFEIMRDAFIAAGAPTIICDPRDLTFDRGGLFAGSQRIDLVYRRVLINDIVAREADCRALVDAYRARAVCVANSLRCKIPHKKAFFAVLTDTQYGHLFTPNEHEAIRKHIPWTAVLEDGRVSRDGRPIDLVPYLRDHRDTFVIKPNDEYGGTGVMLGWETTESTWDDAISRALAESNRGWVAQEQIAVRREPFPVCDQAADGGVAMRDMLVDFAPYVFRGKLAGFLTRLSATGLANVTSGGGQVPAFIVGHSVQ
jgi:uncharacterized circularly permuted ATP-grasp superfamily protein